MAPVGEVLYDRVSHVLPDTAVSVRRLESGKRQIAGTTSTRNHAFRPKVCTPAAKSSSK